MGKYWPWACAATLLLMGIGLSACHRAVTRPVAGLPVLPEAALNPQVIPVKAQNTLRAHYFYVGAGMCHVVECPGANAPVLLDDCGSTNTDGGLSKQQAVAAVQGVAAGHAVKVVLSHSDRDHGNYVPDIFPNPTPATVSMIWGGGSFANYEQPVRDWVRAASQAGVQVRMDNFPNNGVVGFAAGWSNGGVEVPDLQCGTARTYVLTVNSTRGANAASMVLMLDNNGKTLIFPGDATGDTQRQAVENAEENGNPDNFLYTDVLELSHHGAESNGSNDEAWAAATIPRHLVSSAGQSYNHPRCKAIKNYRDAIGVRLLWAPDHTADCGEDGGWWDDPANRGLAIFGTNSNGTLTVDVKANGNEPRTTIYCGQNKCTQ